MYAFETRANCVVLETQDVLFKPLKHKANCHVYARLLNCVTVAVCLKDMLHISQHFVQFNMK